MATQQHAGAAVLLAASVCAIPKQPGTPGRLAHRRGWLRAAVPGLGFRVPKTPTQGARSYRGIQRAQHALRRILLVTPDNAATPWRRN